MPVEFLALSNILSSLMFILLDISISIDLSGMFEYAQQIITAMMPIVALIAGLSLGFVILNKIVGAVRSL